MRFINKAGIDLVVHFEGIHKAVKVSGKTLYAPYEDSAGIPTIGIGTTIYPDGTKVTLKDKPITEEQAYEYFRQHTAKDGKEINRFLSKQGILLDDNAYAALVSFAYNCGTDPITNPDRMLCRGLVAGDKALITSGMKAYNKAHNKHTGQLEVLDGLVSRRDAEVKLFYS